MTIWAAPVTHGSLQARLSGPHSHLQYHTSTKTECICHFCKQTEGTEERTLDFFSSIKC